MKISQNNHGHIDFQKLPNTRDLGGIETQDGKHIKEKMLIRSGALYEATDRDIEELATKFRVKKIIDLRTTEEREMKPDPLEALSRARSEEVKYVSLPLLSMKTFGITRENDLDAHDILKVLEGDPIELMVKVYPQMVCDPASQRGLRAFFDELLADNKEGAVLWHCSAGKDRVGLTTLFLLHILGVPRDVIMDDYLATNEFMELRTNDILDTLTAYSLPSSLGESIAVLNSADERFMQSALDVIDHEYGGIDAYLEKVIEVTPEKASALKERYLKS